MAIIFAEHLDEAQHYYYFQIVRDVNEWFYSIVVFLVVGLRLIDEITIGVFDLRSRDEIEVLYRRVSRW